MRSVVLLNFILLLFCPTHLLKAQESSSSENPVNNCYTFHDVDSTWEEARDACREMGAHLVTFETTEEWNNVRKFIREKVEKGDSDYVHWYIGLRKESGTWRWVGEGSPGVSITEDDPRWQLNEPNTTHGPEFCGEINALYRGQRGHFNNVECDVRYMAKRRKDNGEPVDPRGYICENYKK
ncbi:C-type lectin domain family 4 member D-like [Oculina patagonica]